jgi:CheY-like chemotaxis protein
MVANFSKKGRALVVDDDSLVRNAIRLVLVSDGYDVQTAAGGQQALAALDAGEFDLIVLDFEMPDMKGDQLAEIIKQRLPRLPIIMLTAYGEMLRGSARPMTGVDQLVDKPFSLEALREGIARAFALYKDAPKA